MDMGETRFVTVYGFQSTLSVRRATDLVISPDFVQDISIHALRKESDPALQPLMGALQFQSTLSVRRATGEEDRLESLRQDFNPRSP